MKTTTGWDVYLRIKELSHKDGTRPPIRIDTLTREFGIKKETMREFIAALAVLNFIEYTDDTKEVFVMTELGKE